jgi:transposase
VASAADRNELWEQIEPLLPSEPEPSPKGGRPRVTNRQTLTGIVFVLRTGIPWQALPTEMDCGSGSTCWRRFSEWTQLSVWSNLHSLLLSQLGKAGAINLERAVIDSASVRAVFGGRTLGRTRRTVRKPVVSGMC